jgi:2'-5' RNA ligase
MYSLWLVPAEPLKSQLHSIIQKLAVRYDAVDFEPHVTISAGGIVDDDETCTVMRKIVRQFGPIELTARGLDFTSIYTKTLFVQFHESEMARRMFEAIKENSSQSSKYELNAHLSLLYKTISPETQAEICRTLDMPKGNYFFDGLRAIDTENPLTQPEQIKRWRIVYEAVLGQPKD